MKYKTTVVTCSYNKTEKKYDLPVMTPPGPGWAVVNFQPCVSSHSFESAYLVLWEKEE